MTMDGIEQIRFLKTLKTVPCMDSACPPPPFWGFRGQGVTSVAPSLPLPVCIWSWLKTQGTCRVVWTWLLTVPAGSPGTLQSLLDTQGWRLQDLDMPVGVSKEVRAQDMDWNVCSSPSGAPVM